MSRNGKILKLRATKLKGFTITDKNKNISVKHERKDQ